MKHPHRLAAAWLVALGCHCAAAPAVLAPVGATSPPPGPLTVSAEPQASAAAPPGPAASGEPGDAPPLPALVPGAIWGEFTWTTGLASAEQALARAGYTVRVGPHVFQGQPEERSAVLGPWMILLRSHEKEPWPLTEIQIHGTNLTEQVARAAEARAQARHGEPKERLFQRDYEWRPEAETARASARALRRQPDPKARRERGASAPPEPRFELHITLTAGSPGPAGFGSLRWGTGRPEVERQLRASGASVQWLEERPIEHCEPPSLPRGCGVEVFLKFKSGARSGVVTLRSPAGLSEIRFLPEVVDEPSLQKRIREIEALHGQATSVEETRTSLWESPLARVSFSLTHRQPQNTFGLHENHEIPSRTARPR